MAYQKVFDFKEVTIEYRSTGASVFQFQTDLPGGTMAIRLPLSAPSSAGWSLASSGGIGITKTVTVPLDGVQGTLYQPSITPSGSAQIIVLSAKLWLRPIGVYLDGTLGEEWITQPIAVGA